MIGLVGLAGVGFSVMRHIQWLGLGCAFIVGAAFSFIISSWRNSARASPPGNVPPVSIPGSFTISGIDFAWTSCARFVDAQLDSIERLDIKLGIVIAGLVSAAGIFFDRAHGVFAAALGLIALCALLFALLGFLLGHYQNSPDPRAVVDSINADARATKAQLLDGFIESFDSNQIIIYKKGRYLHWAALLIFAAVVIATVGKAYDEIGHQLTSTQSKNAHHQK